MPKRLQDNLDTGGKKNFTSCDWGTTNLRLRKIVGGEVIASSSSTHGAASLSTPDQFRQVLFQEMKQLDAEPPVVISGMAGSSIGWKELPYAGLPFALDGSGAVFEEVEEGIYLLSGVCSAEDIMRGEETELLGLEKLPADAVVILPGTHSKHCRVKNGSLLGFRTFMTGELFAVLSEHSVLQKSVTKGWSASGFLEGVCHGSTNPLSASLFSVRARQVLGKITPADNSAYLSGVLIGGELASLPDEVPLLLASGGELGDGYRLAFQELGLCARTTFLSSEEWNSLVWKGQRKILSHFRPR